MRAISIFLIIVSFLMTSCASLEVVKGVTKATQSLETSIKKIIKSSSDEKEKEQNIPIEEEKHKILVEEQNIPIEEEKEHKILVEEQKISKEQKMVTNIVKRQKKISNIDLLGKTIKELHEQIGKPSLIREVENTTTARFDSKSCRLFVFMNATIKTPRIEYYEMRDNEGELIDNREDIESCFKEIKPV
jgi:hypothetical protein